MQKILVPIDSIKQDHTFLGVKKSLELAEGLSIGGKPPQLIFVHSLFHKPRIPIDERERLGDLKRKELEEEFGTIKEMCEDRDLDNIKTLIEKGKPEEKIVEIAQEEGVDYIVMGSGKLHDRSTKGRIEKFIYGSTTEKVIHEAPCSICIARAPKEERKSSRILIPIDSITFDNTLLAVKRAINHAKECETDGEPELIFMHVWNVESSEMSTKEEKRARNLREEEMEKEFKEIEKMCRERELSNFKTVFNKGGAAHKEIVKTAREKDVNLIIIGSGRLHDRSVKGKIQKFVHGSTTEEVIHETPCSILVAR